MDYIDANVAPYMPVDPRLMVEIARLCVTPGKAAPGDIVGISAAIFRIGRSVEHNDICFLRATDDPATPEQVDPETLVDHPRSRDLFFLLSRFLRADFGRLAETDLIEIEDSSIEDGFHLYGLHLLPRAAMITDSIHEPGYISGDDVATTNALFVEAPTSNHEVFSRQEEIDAVLAIFAALSITGDIADDTAYAPLTLAGISSAA